MNVIISATIAAICLWKARKATGLEKVLLNLAAMDGTTEELENTAWWCIVARRCCRGSLASMGLGMMAVRAAAEIEAYADAAYVEILKGLAAAVEQEETLRWGLVSAQARIDVWRSTEASNRAMDKAVM